MNSSRDVINAQLKEHRPFQKRIVTRNKARTLPNRRWTEIFERHVSLARVAIVANLPLGSDRNPRGGFSTLEQERLKFPALASQAQSPVQLGTAMWNFSP